MVYDNSCALNIYYLSIKTTFIHFFSSALLASNKDFRVWSKGFIRCSQLWWNINWLVHWYFQLNAVRVIRNTIHRKNIDYPVLTVVQFKNGGMRPKTTWETVVAVTRTTHQKRTKRMCFEDLSPESTNPTRSTGSFFPTPNLCSFQIRAWYEHVVLGTATAALLQN